ncbi:hypothetical protein [Mycoplasma sp. Mirounga ES2805-ORL]|uniref:hypothetical protein n=1 Tax=Mycoplasma sp. Mirounga ES2805-ORL TaxID=754514 RepID=UPI00197B9A63|nr:hypothetical protein [Mycoplasma sp. Mirounga ES2805-ORL]QSF13384.1 hypothetical protein JXZ90_01750 [Mycoplasma sp. Mirounga ES2805-ORL]
MKVIKKSIAILVFLSIGMFICSVVSLIKFIDEYDKYQKISFIKYEPSFELILFGILSLACFLFTLSFTWMWVKIKMTNLTVGEKGIKIKTHKGTKLYEYKDISSIDTFGKPNRKGLHQTISIDVKHLENPLQVFFIKNADEVVKYIDNKIHELNNQNISINKDE